MKSGGKKSGKPKRGADSGGGSQLLKREDSEDIQLSISGLPSGVATEEKNEIENENENENENGVAVEEEDDSKNTSIDIDVSTVETGESASVVADSQVEKMDMAEKEQKL